MPQKACNMAKTKSTVCQERFKDYCFFCGCPVIGREHHLIFGSANRQKADEDGLKVPICDHCHTIGKLWERIHDNTMAEKLSKMFGQAIYERNALANKEVQTIDEAREKFRRRYGQSYF